MCWLPPRNCFHSFCLYNSFYLDDSRCALRLPFYRYGNSVMERLENVPEIIHPVSQSVVTLESHLRESGSTQAQPSCMIQYVTFQMKKLEPQDSPWPGLGHTASEHQRWDQNSGILTPVQQAFWGFPSSPGGGEGVNWGAGSQWGPIQA